MPNIPESLRDSKFIEILSECDNSEIFEFELI